MHDFSSLLNITLHVSDGLLMMDGKIVRNI